MKSNLLASVFVLSAAMATTVSAQTTNQYPFQNPNMPLEERVNNIISLMTLDEKMALLSQRPGVPRLGIRTMQQAEGLHGVRGGGATTTYPQSIGLGETWDTEILHQVGATEGYEARYIFQCHNGPGFAGQRRRRRLPDHPGAQRRHRPRHPLGPHRGVLRRGPVPQRHSGRRVHQGHAG